MSNKDNSGPAFPLGRAEAEVYASALEDLANPSLDDAERAHLEAKALALCALTKREYAAIKLKVPDSGTDWLDDMIRESLRNKFALEALQKFEWRSPEKDQVSAKDCYQIADAVMKAGKS